MRAPAVSSALLAVLLLTSCGRGTATTPAPAIGVPDRLNAFASAAASGRFAVVTWGATTASDGITDVYAAVSHDGGASFDVPVRVNDQAAHANLSGEQPPRVALQPRAEGDPRVSILWTSRTADGTRLVTASSDDGGRTFGPQQTIAASQAPGNRGWESLAAGSNGVMALWLDHRELAARPAAAGAPSVHQHGAGGMEHEGGAERAQLSRLYFGRLDHPASMRPLTGGVCYCCKTALTTDGGNGVYAAWRHVYPGNIRDIAFTMSADGGRTFSDPLRVSQDNWVLDGCPENGPAIAVDADHAIHVAWPTLLPARSAGEEPQMALFYATSRDGHGFTARLQLPTVDFPRHAQLALTRDGAPVVAWDEQARGSRRVVLARGTRDASGAITFTRQVIADDDNPVYPALAASDAGLMIVWASGGNEPRPLHVTVSR